MIMMRHWLFAWVGLYWLYSIVRRDVPEIGTLVTKDASRIRTCIVYEMIDIITHTSRTAFALLKQNSCGGRESPDYWRMQAWVRHCYANASTYWLRQSLLLQLKSSLRADLRDQCIFFFVLSFSFANLAYDTPAKTWAALKARASS